MFFEDSNRRPVKSKEDFRDTKTDAERQLGFGPTRV